LYVYRNTLSIVALQHLIEEIKSAGDDLSLKSIVICGDGPVFSAGHNLKELVSYNIYFLLFKLGMGRYHFLLILYYTILCCRYKTNIRYQKYFLEK